MKEGSYRSNKHWRKLQDKEQKKTLEGTLRHLGDMFQVQFWLLVVISLLLFGIFCYVTSYWIFYLR